MSFQTNLNTHTGVPEGLCWKRQWARYAPSHGRRSPGADNCSSVSICFRRQQIFPDVLLQLIEQHEPIHSHVKIRPNYIAYMS